MVFSGGLDSTVLLYNTAQTKSEVIAVTFIYGQTHIVELKYASELLSYAKYRWMNLHHVFIDLITLRPVLRSSLTHHLTIPDVPETAEHYETLTTTVVPNRNAIFLSIAVGIAVSAGYQNVYYGAHRSDRGVYPDCRIEFVRAFQKQARLANATPELKVVAPFVDMSKTEIVSLGQKLGVPFEKTWSCYKGGKIHCGTCSSCRERKKAFRDAGVTDHTFYLV